MKNKLSLFTKELIFLYISIIVGAYLRLYGVFTNSFAFTYDVGRDMIALSNIVNLHKISLIGATTGIPGVFYGPWWYIMLVPFYIISGGDPAGIASIMALIGILVIFLAYFFGRKLVSSFFGVIFAAFIAVSPSLISLSSQIWNPNIAPFFVLLTFFVMYKIFTQRAKTKSYIFFFLGILLSLNIDIEILWGILFTLSTILSLLIILRRQINLRHVISLFAGLILIAAPRIMFEVRHNFLMTQSFIRYFQGKQEVENLSFVQVFMDRVHIFINEIAKSFAGSNDLYAMILVPLIILVLILTYKKSSPVFKNFILYSAITIATYFTTTLFFKHTIWPHYLVGLPIFYVFIIAASLVSLGHLKLKQWHIFVIVLLILFLNFNPVVFINNFNKPVFTGDQSVYRNQVEVIDYVYKQASGRPFKYVVYTPPVYDFTYKYLFNWYGKKQYKYIPVEKANLAYFIIEPDPGYELRLNDWLKLREKDGKIIKSVKLNSGIIIQTRVP